MQIRLTNDEFVDCILIGYRHKFGHSNIPDSSSISFLTSDQDGDREVAETPEIIAINLGQKPNPSPQDLLNMVKEARVLLEPKEDPDGEAWHNKFERYFDDYKSIKT